MADTGTSTKLVYQRIMRILREDAALKSRLQGRVYDANKKTINPSEMPSVVVNVESVGEEIVSEYPYMVRSTALFSIVVMVEEWDPTRADFGGGREGRGLADYAQDVKQAFRNNLNLSGLCQTFSFPTTTLFDNEAYPARAVKIDMSVRFLEAMRARESAAI